MEDPKKNEILIDDFFNEGKQLIKEMIYNEGNINVMNLGILLNTKEVNPQNNKDIINETLTINQILMLKANSEYSAERLKTKRFALFMHNRINMVVKRKEDFQKYLDAFKLHFEALVGYYPRDKKEKENQNENQ